MRRSTQLNDNLRRAREHQKQRESLSMTMPGYDSAMNTASKILNLTQDDLDDIMSTTDDSFNVRFFLFSSDAMLLFDEFCRDMPSRSLRIKVIKYDRKYRNYWRRRRNSLANY